MSLACQRIRAGVVPTEGWTPALNATALFRYVDISSVDRETKRLTGTAELPVGQAPSRARQLLRAGDVLVSTVRPNLNAVAIVPQELDGAVGSTGFTVLRSDRARLLPRYLFHWVRTPMFVAEMVKRATGANYPAISDRIVLDSRMPMPDLDEQRRIADTLDSADSIREKRKAEIALTEKLLQSAFLEMCGNPVTNSKRWPLKPLGDLLAFMTSGSRGWAQYYADAGEMFLRIQNVRRDRLDLSDVAYVEAPDSAEARRTEARPGDVLLSITADLGRTAVIPETLHRAFINQHLAILRPRGVRADYLSAFLASAGGQRQINRRNKGGVKAGLNFDDIRSVEVPVPPRETQEEFASAKKRIGEMEAKCLQALRDDNNLFSALVARAFCKSPETAC